MSSIYGIGPSKASYFYETYNIKNIKDLLDAEKKGKIELSEQMKMGIKYKNLLNQNIPRILIARLESFISDTLYKVDSGFIVVICGSFRRGKDISSDVDILITNKKLTDKKDCGKYLKIVIDALSKYFIVDSLTTTLNRHYQGFASFKKIPNLPNSYDTKIFNIEKDVIRFDIIIIPTQYFFGALLHFSSGVPYNQKLRLHAKSLDMKLNEFGLFKYEKGKEILIPANSESDIFNALLLKYIPSENR